MSYAILVCAIAGAGYWLGRIHGARRRRPALAARETPRHVYRYIDPQIFES